MFKFKNVLLAGLIPLVAATAADANTVSGKLWHVSDAIAGNATFANVPGTTADVTFSVDGTIDFDSRVGGYTVGQFLQSVAGHFASNIVENTAGTLSSSANDIIILFEGQVSVLNGETFTVTHDDGLQLDIDGTLVIDEPGGTPPVQTTRTYGGPDGNFNFKLVYGECCGAPGVLQIDLPFQSVPEPGSLALLGAALLAAGSRRRIFGA